MRLSSSTSHFKNRRIALIVIAAVLVAVFSIRLMQFQIVEGDELREKADQTSSLNIPIEAARGEIVDRNGKPLSAVRSGYNITFDKAFLPSGKENETILMLIEIMQSADEPWNDNLPITQTENGYEFTADQEAAVKQLKTKFRLADYATAQNAMDRLISEYELEEVPAEKQRQVAGVRYEMTLRAWSLSNPFIFASDVSIDTVVKIKENATFLPGVDIAQAPIREYVSGSLAPHILGDIAAMDPGEYENYSKNDSRYSRNDLVGKSGIEKKYESYLKGTNGVRQIEKNAHGDILSETIVKEPVPGNSVRLTIDYDLQALLRDALQRNIEWIKEQNKPEVGADVAGGAAVVLNVKTGEVLAMANYPTYDLQDYRKNYAELANNELHPLTNRATMGLYSPGSSFKPVTALGGLAEGAIDLNSQITCTGTYMYFASSHFTPGCLAHHGTIGLEYALQESCNIYFYETGRRLGIEKMGYYANKLGLGIQSTGIEIPETTKAQIAGPDNTTPWTPGNVVQAAIGQISTQVSPLQLAVYASTLANHGKRMEVHVVKSIENYDLGQIVEKTEPKVADTIETEDAYFDLITKGMEDAFRINSTTKGMFGDYPVNFAIKTGTPQTAEGTSPNGTIIAFGPTEDPDIAIAVVIEHAGHGYYGARTVKEVLDYLYVEGKAADLLK